MARHERSFNCDEKGLISMVQMVIGTNDATRDTVSELRDAIQESTKVAKDSSKIDRFNAKTIKRCNYQKRGH